MCVVWTVVVLLGFQTELPKIVPIFVLVVKEFCNKQGSTNATGTSHCRVRVDAHEILKAIEESASRLNVPLSEFVSVFACTPTIVDTLP